MGTHHSSSPCSAQSSWTNPSNFHLLPEKGKSCTECQSLQLFWWLPERLASVSPVSEWWQDPVYSKCPGSLTTKTVVWTSTQVLATALPHSTKEWKKTPNSQLSMGRDRVGLHIQCSNFSECCPRTGFSFTGLRTLMGQTRHALDF